MAGKQTEDGLSRSLLWLLAAIGALGSLATHMFIPAMPLAAAALHVVPSTMQLTVGVYLFGLSAGQLLSGPLVDRIGRKPVLLGGSALFLVASLAACAAPNAELLIASRFVQACGGAAGLVATRALVSDLSSREMVASNLAAMTSVILLSPTFAPTIGGVVASLAGWRAVFALLAMLAAVTGLASLLIVPWQPRREAPAPVLASYVRLLRNARFRGFVATNALASSALYIFLAASSFLLIRQYGLTPAEAGLCYLAIAAGGVVGTIVLRRRGGDMPLQFGLTVMVGGAVVMELLALAHVHGFAALVLPMVVVSLGAGMSAPLGIAGAMHSEEGLAGTGSSLAGAIQMLSSGLASAAVTALVGATPQGIGAAVLICAVVARVVAPQG